MASRRDDFLSNADDSVVECRAFSHNWEDAGDFMMCRQYLDPVALIEWLNRSAQLIGPGGRGISMLRTNTVKPRGGTRHGNKETRRWGS